MLACAVAALWLAAAGDLQPLDARGEPIDLPDDALLQAALRRNQEEHGLESAAACEAFFCGEASAEAVAVGKGDFDAYSMGPVPSIDFPSAFGGDDIHVSRHPLFSPEECDEVVRLAELEGEGLPSTKSGKYQLGKAWIKDMPSVLAWFNGALQTRLFPSLSALFPHLLPDTRSLRAHSVAILKYNASHPRTDVHVDDALFAFTIALSHGSAFQGGGTYFEAIDRVVDMPQGHATFRPGAVRHAGSEVTSGVRYVIGGFIASSDKVEHVRRLNERGNRILLSDPTPAQLTEAARLFEWGLLLNGNCSLCHQNLGDTHLRLDQPELAERSLRRQIALLPRDSDAYYGLGNALLGQERNEEALAAYDGAVGITPSDYESHVGRASALAALEDARGEAEAYKAALRIRPNDVRIWLNVGIAYSHVDDIEDALAAFEAAVVIAPDDARPPLNLGRYYAKLSRPGEAIAQFYDAAVIEPEYFEEVKLGVGTARAQQGRLDEAIVNFESASRMSPKNEKLKASLTEMKSRAAEIAEAARGVANALEEVCGTPCQDVVDGSGYVACALTWEAGCGDAPPPDGFTAASTIADVCAKSCIFYTEESHKQQQQQQQP